MKKLRSWLPSAITLTMLYGCSSSENSKKNFKLIANESALPSHFDDQHVVRLTSEYSDIKDLWKMYGLKARLPELDLAKEDVLFIDITESRSCPYTVGNVKSENNTLTVTLSKKDGVCTSDANPRTFVIAVDKEYTKGNKTINIVDNNEKSILPFKIE